MGNDNLVNAIVDCESITVFVCFPDKIAGDDRLVEMESALSLREQARRHRMTRQRDRHRFVVTWVMVRHILARRIGMDPSQLVFVRGAQGKPEIADDQNPSGVTFNVSHTAESIVCAVARNRAIGIDVEPLSRRPSSLDIARRFFSPSEVALLAQVQDIKRGQRFIELWTLKEAYIKARGLGLPLPLGQFTLHLDDSAHVLMEVAPDMSDDPNRWRFFQWILSPDSESTSPEVGQPRADQPHHAGYCVALAVEVRDKSGDRIQVLSWSPKGTRQKDTGIKILRTSAT